MIEQLRQVFADSLEIRTGEVTDDYSRESSDRWDSLGHMRLITAVEEEFNVVFTMDEIERIASFEVLARELGRKLS